MDFLNTKEPKLKSKTHELLEDSVQSMKKGQKVFIVGLCGGQGGEKQNYQKFLIPKSAIIEERQKLF